MALQSRRSIGTSLRDLETALTAPIDDVANGLGERTRRSPFGVDRAELGDIRVVAQPAKRQACSVSLWRIAI